MITFGPTNPSSQPTKPTLDRKASGAHPNWILSSPRSYTSDLRFALPMVPFPFPDAHRCFRSNRRLTSSIASLFARLPPIFDRSWETININVNIQHQHPTSTNPLSSATLPYRPLFMQNQPRLAIIDL